MVEKMTVSLEALCLARYGPEFTSLREDEQLTLMDAERKPIQAYLRARAEIGPAAVTFACTALAAELDPATPPAPRSDASQRSEP